jgi:hypothetical protein
MGSTLKTFLSGVVGIGVITALVLPGRQTAKVLAAGGKAGSGLLGTAITGKA